MTQWQRAYVVHQRHFSDSRYWVDLITQYAGRVTLIWRKNKKMPPLIPFTPYSVSWDKRGEFRVLSGCEAESAPITLQGKALFCGFYINELCQRLLPQEEDSSIPFNAYEKVIHGLFQGDQLEQPLREFEWQLICHLGFEFSFTHLGFNNEPICSHKRYQFNPQAGFEPAQDSAGYLGGDLISLSRGAWNDELSRIAKVIFRRAIQSRLGAKPLRSREYFR